MLSLGLNRICVFCNVKPNIGVRPWKKKESSIALRDIQRVYVDKTGQIANFINGVIWASLSDVWLNREKTDFLESLVNECVGEGKLSYMDMCRVATWINSCRG